MVAHTLHHRRGAGVANREPFAGHAVEERLTAGGAVQHHVAHQDIVLRHKRRRAWRIDDNAAAGEALAHIVVGVAFQHQSHARGEKRAEALTRAAVERDTDCFVRESGRSVFLRDGAREHRTHCAMHIADGQVELHRRAILNRLGGEFDQAVVQRRLDPVILLGGATPRHAARRRRIVENRGEVQALRLPVVDGLAHLQPLDAAHHLIDGAIAEPRHDLPHLFRHEEEVVDHRFRLARELRAQRRILRRNAHRTRIQVALAHHDAAQCDERHRGEAELLGAQQRRNGHVAAGLQFAVSLYANAAAQVVHHQYLLRLSQA